MFLFVKKFLKCWLHRTTGFIFGNVFALYNMRYEDIDKSKPLKEQMDFYAMLADLWAKFKLTNYWILFNEKIEYVSYSLHVSKIVLICFVLFMIISVVRILLYPVVYIWKKIWKLLVYINDRYLIELDNWVLNKIKEKIRANQKEVKVNKKEDRTEEVKKESKSSTGIKKIKIK